MDFREGNIQGVGRPDKGVMRGGVEVLPNSRQGSYSEDMDPGYKLGQPGALREATVKGKDMWKG